MMKASIEGGVLKTSTVSVDLQEIVATSRTDVPLAGWCYIIAVVAGGYYANQLGLIWWVGVAATILLLLLPAFVIPLSKLKVYTRSHSFVVRGTTSHLVDLSEEICQVLAQRQ